LCIAYDVESYSGRDSRDQIDVQRRLALALEQVRALAGIAPGDFVNQEQGDGGLILLPTGGEVDEPLMIARFLSALESALADANRNLILDAQMRMRVVLVEGVVFAGANGYVGDAVVGAFRMCNAQPVRSALAAVPDANLVLVVSDGLYRDVVRHGHYGLPGAEFVRHTLELKEFSDVAWICVRRAHATPPGWSAAAGAGPTGESGHSPADERSTSLLSRTLDTEGPQDGW
jgi:hypothetical protein